ncbi:hypothetical protein [Gilliamella sp. Pas-s95]|uniref:hypothetical protein n=1 Tax=Gilliamella sp. Pas-s95 TaxID=2687317 RepID=UPI00132B28D8|nr:hypothetical protein [Gilliamella sp. Pas-s95]MWN06763.1 hypothetical protein [Gilliamella sp. Pas-s95]
MNSPRPKLLSSLSKSSLLFAPLLLLPYSFDSQALSAYTSRVIEGSAPYLTYDNGRTKATTTADLLSITLSDNRTFTPSNGSSATNPIVLPVAGQSFTDIHMMVPPSTNSVSLSELVTSYHYWGDDDGDGQGTNGVTATGSLSVAITDKNNRAVGRGTVLSICNAPYKVVLSSSAGRLTTQYGLPNSSTFSGSTATYYLSPPPSPGICYARPELTRRRNTSNWDPNRGFATQSTEPSSYDLNFPKTGANGLYFDLDIVGVDANQLNWAPVTRGGITVTVTRMTANDSWLPNGSELVTRVTLTSNPYPSSSSDTPSLPQVFELEGKDRSGNTVVKYGFKIRVWSIPRSSTVQLNHLRSYCSNLGYRVPDGGPLNSFFSEWGMVGSYDGTRFYNGRYFTNYEEGTGGSYHYGSTITPSGSASRMHLSDAAGRYHRKAYGLCMS